MLTSFDVSTSSVAELVGSKEFVETVRAPPRMLVSRPPLAVVRVAQPEAKRRAARAAERRSFDFMGRALKAVDGTLMGGGSFVRFRAAHFRKSRGATRSRDLDSRF